MRSSAIRGGVRALSLTALRAALPYLTRLAAVGLAPITDRANAEALPAIARCADDSPERQHVPAAT